MPPKPHPDDPEGPVTVTFHLTSPLAATRSAAFPTLDLRAIVRELKRGRLRGVFVAYDRQERRGSIFIAGNHHAGTFTVEEGDPNE